MKEMTLDDALCILRNPWGKSEAEQREARLWAADQLERNEVLRLMRQREIAILWERQRAQMTATPNI